MRVNCAKLVGVDEIRLGNWDVVLYFALAYINFNCLNPKTVTLIQIKMGHFCL